jgi:hypothetical protein
MQIPYSQMGMIAAPPYSELSVCDRRELRAAGITNGCGPCGHLMARLVPEFDFHGACQNHDYDYFLGGTELDRHTADDMFLLRMYGAARSRKSLLRRLAVKALARVYHWSVRTFGQTSFNYTNPIHTVADLHDAVRAASRKLHATR